MSSLARLRFIRTTGRVGRNTVLHPRSTILQSLRTSSTATASIHTSSSTASSTTAQHAASFSTLAGTATANTTSPLANAQFKSFATYTPFETTNPLPPVHLPEKPLMTSPFPPVPPIPKANGPVNLILPPTEDREHRYFTLSNGLEVIVVTDPKSDKAAASMDVGVGHLSDPVDLPGCAHFCEHLLFMGTKKFPSENEYQAYLSSHNGHSNAYTAMTSTVYYFDVASDALEGALDRFAGFFNEPLFNEDCTEREIKAVDSEHKKNINNDMWRFFQLEKHVMNNDHPYHKFGTGNHKSLWDKPKSEGRDPRQQLIDWWAKYYCAKRMKLVVAGKEDLDTLEAWVRQRFEQIPVRSDELVPVGEEGVRIAFTESPVGPKEMGVVTIAKPIQDTRGLEITFPFPDVDHLYGSKPSHYITHFVGHEGRGSILSCLKQKGWSNYLRAGLAHGAAGFDFMKITVDLTKEGLENWQEVAKIIFKYVNLLRAEPPSSAVFDEIKAIADISFRFAEKTKTGRYATALSTWMQKPLPRDKIVSGNSLLEEFKPDELAFTLQLLDPRRAMVGVTCRDMPKDVTATFDQKEPIYGTEYTQFKLSDEFLKEAMSGAPVADLHLPGKNPFIPERLDVEKFEVDTPAMRPELLKNNELSRLWYKRDDRFWLPKANVDVLLHSPILNNTPRNSVLARVFCDLYRDSIGEDIYDADMAELSYSLHYAGDSISIGAGGFSDKLALLLEAMLERLAAFTVDEARFSNVVDDIRMHWENFPLGVPYHQIGYWHSYVTTQIVWTQEEKLKELALIKPQEVEAFAKEIMSRMFVETLVHGNTTSGEAQKIQEMVERVLQPRALAEGEKNNLRTLILPRGSEHIWSRQVANKSEVNSAIIYSVQIGESSDLKLRAALQLFAQIVQEPVFNQLRTTEQLGYIAQGYASHSVGIMSYRFLVQSERDPGYVETRIEVLLDHLKEVIEKLSDEDFEKHRAALLSKKEEKPKNLGEEGRRFWSAISDRFYEFSKRETDIENLKKATKQDVLDLLMTHIHYSSTTRAKLSTHLKSQYKGIKFDLTSATPLVEAFTKHNVAVDQAALQKLMGTQPDLSTVKDSAAAAVKAATDLAEEAKKELEGVIEGLKGTEAGESEKEGAAAWKVRESNVYIEDIHRFKAGLIPSKAAYPVEPLQTTAKL